MLSFEERIKRMNLTDEQRKAVGQAAAALTPEAVMKETVTVPVSLSGKTLASWRVLHDIAVERFVKDSASPRFDSTRALDVLSESEAFLTELENSWIEAAALRFIRDRV